MQGDDQQEVCPRGLNNESGRVLQSARPGTHQENPLPPSVSLSLRLSLLALLDLQINTSYTASLRFASGLTRGMTDSLPVPTANETESVFISSLSRLLPSYAPTDDNLRCTEEVTHFPDFVS